MAIARSGLKKVLPPGIRLISGPGCPVCVTAQESIDRAIAIAKMKGVIFTSFGDMLRVPGSAESLAGVKAEGADVRIVYSPADAVSIAERNPEKKIVFMGIGFETTSPVVAAAVIDAKEKGVKNFSVLANFKILFPALEALSSARDVRVDGFLCPGHVSVITGTKPYESFVRKFKKPCVIAGFTGTDIIKAVLSIVKQIKEGVPKVEIEYTRAVTPDGNLKARRAADEVFMGADSVWRGLGGIKKSGLVFRKKYRSFDADLIFREVRVKKYQAGRKCRCGDVLRGAVTPRGCGFFGKTCTPANPKGPCMVSGEGTCAAYYTYGG